MKNVKGFIADLPEERGCGERCMNYIAREGYEFIEMEVETPNPRLLVSVPGLYRFSVQPRGDKNCKLFNRYRRDHETYPYNDPKICIAAEKIQKHSTAYKYEEEKNIDIFWFGRMFQIAVYIRSDDEILYSYAGYSVEYFVYWLLGFENPISGYGEDVRTLSVKDVLAPS